MGNQQERSIAWLAGIMDGEGTISFQVYTLPDGRVRITPFMCVVNSDEGVLGEVRRIFDELLEGQRGGKTRVCSHPVSPQQTFASTKTCKLLRVDGIATKPILEALLPDLRSEKRIAAQAVLTYLESRKKGLLLRDKTGRIQRLGYTRAEVELVASIRTSKRAKSSEAICSAPNVIG